MSKLSEALEALVECMEGTWQDRKLLQEAQAELLEFQRIQSTVKEFIAKHNVKSRGNINGCEVDDVYTAFKDLCDIVGYSE